jgi:hypothetical protein
MGTVVVLDAVDGDPADHFSILESVRIVSSLVEILGSVSIGRGSVRCPDHLDAVLHHGDDHLSSAAQG